MKLDEFINTIKPMITIKESAFHKGKVHYMGSTILTNQEMKVMLETMLGDDYTKLSNAAKKKLRREIFAKLDD